MTPLLPLRDRSAFLVAIAMLLFFPPLLLVADHAALVFGVPVFLVYLFTCWAVVIGAGAVLSHKLARAARHSLPRD